MNIEYVNYMCCWETLSVPPMTGTYIYHVLSARKQDMFITSHACTINTVYQRPGDVYHMCVLKELLSVFLIPDQRIGITLTSNHDYLSDNCLILAIQRIGNTPVPQMAHCTTNIHRAQSVVA